MTAAYESQLELVRALRPANSDDDRHIRWCLPGSPIGLAKNPKGLIEIFLEGPPLQAQFRRVREALEYQQWFRSDGGALLANRLLLPAAGHFEQVAAFLCTELLRNGAVADLPGAFARTEPLIDMTIVDLLIADETFIGLCGEMLVLAELVQAAPGGELRTVLDSWVGSREAARDMQLPWTGVEIKTTTRGTSSHRFSGVHQLEVGHGVDEAEESTFLLVSIGIEWAGNADRDVSTSLPETIDRIVSRITAALGTAADVAVAEFIDRIAAYGAPTSLGYDHRTMATSSRFSRRFNLRFARGYDMADSNIRLLTSDDLRARPFINAESLSLRVDLPDQVSGDVNPVVGLSNLVRWIVARSWPTEPSPTSA